MNNPLRVATCSNISASGKCLEEVDGRVGSNRIAQTAAIQDLRVIDEHRDVLAQRSLIVEHVAANSGKAMEGGFERCANRRPGHLEIVEFAAVAGEMGGEANQGHADQYTGIADARTATDRRPAAGATI